MVFGRAFGLTALFFYCVFCAQAGRAQAPRRAPASIPGSTVLLKKGMKESKEQLRQRFARALRLFESRDERAVVRLDIKESDGTIKRRELVLHRAGEKGEQRMLARVRAPADLRGSSVLIVATKQAESQWIFLPSSKQTRRIVTGDQKGTILGSELRYEDLNPSVIRRSSINLLRTERIEGKNYDVFEVRIPKGSSPYDRAWVWIDKKSEMPITIEYYVKNTKVKTIEFFDYYKIGSIWRPARLSIKNLVNSRGTEIEISQLAINTGLPLNRLNVENLSRPW